MHMLHTCKNGLKLTCLVPGVVRAWTWCPAGITLGSALKYPIYYFDELPKRMLHWHTRSTENSLLPLVPDPQYFHRSHSFTMKFGADNNGSHLPFSRQRNVADSALSVWTSVYTTCSSKAAKFCCDTHLSGVKQMSGSTGTHVCHQYLILCTLLNGCHGVSGISNGVSSAPPFSQFTLKMSM